jgi:hypothetical protein
MCPPRSFSEDSGARNRDLSDVYQSIQSVREDSLVALLDNPALTEAEILLLLNRRNLPIRVIEEIASRPKWLASYRVKLALVRNSRTPVKVSLGLLKYLFLFDLVMVSLLPAVARELKDLSESLILSQLPKLALGESVTLARRASSKVAGALLIARNTHVIQGVLDNPRVTAGTIVRALNLPACSLMLVNLVSRHRKWQNIYDVRLALLRSPHLPTARALKFISEMKEMDLRELADDPKVGKQLRQYLKRSVGLT